MVKGWNPILVFIMFSKDKTASFLKSHKLTEIEEKGEKVNEKNEEYLPPKINEF